MRKAVGTLGAALVALVLGVSGCGGGGSGGGASAAPAITFSASPTSLLVGEHVGLTWSASNANSCTASGAWTGNQVANGSANLTVNAPGSLSYTLTCTGAGGTTVVSTTVAAVNGPFAIRTPAGFRVDPESTHSNTPVAFNTFNSAYQRGGVIPPNGAEIIVTNEALPPPPLDNLIDVQIHNEGGVVTSRSTRTVSGVSCTQVAYTETESGVTTKILTVYCPFGTRLNKFYLSYYSGDPQESTYLASFGGLLNGVVFTV